MLAKLYTLYYHIEGAWMLLQYKIFRGLIDDMSGYIILRSMSSLIAFALTILAYHFICHNWILSVIIGLTVFVPLISYYRKAKYNPVNERKKMEDFLKLSRMIRFFYISILSFIFIIMPILVLCLLIF